MNIVVLKVRKGKGKRVGNIILWQSGSGKKGNEAERKRPVYRNASAEFCYGICKYFDYFVRLLVNKIFLQQYLRRILFSIMQIDYFMIDFYLLTKPLSHRLLEYLHRSLCRSFANTLFYSFFVTIFIGPRSDHSQRMSVTN